MTFDIQELPDRFSVKVDVDDESGCWLWEAALSGEVGQWNGGYPYYRLGDRMVGAHRYAFQQLMQVSISGFDLHHTCGVRRCVNPDHLEAMDRREHMVETGVLPA